MNELVKEQIVRQNDQIERLLNQFDNPYCDFNLVCVEIILHLRTLIEHLIVYHYGMEKGIECRMEKEKLREYVSYMKKEKLIFLQKTHYYLQACASHYVIDDISAPRLLSKYLANLIQIKKWFYDKYDIQLLNNLSKFSINKNKDFVNYYSEIYKVACSVETAEFIETKDRYYVMKSIPHFAGDSLIYETTLVIASDFASKFNRFIVFSKFEIPETYAVKVNLYSDRIIANGNVIPIKIVKAYEISIRPCEFNNLGKLVGINERVYSNLNEYKNLMKYLTKTKIGIDEIVLSDEEDFKKIELLALKDSEKEEHFHYIEKS